MIKKIVILAIVIMTIGGAGYYYGPDGLKNLWERLSALAGDYYNKAQRKTPTAASSADNTPHQASLPVMAQGNAVALDAKARQLAGLQTTRVIVKALNKAINTTGKIAMNENGKTYLTSRVEGRIDKLSVTAEGEYVAPGRAIASVYSPSYIAAQEEYLLTLENVEKLKNAGKEIAQINNRLRDAARKKLKLLNVSDRDIANLEKNRQPKEHMTIYAQFGGTVLERQVLPGAYIRPGDKLYSLADLSKVWLYVDIYEKDLSGVNIDQPVTVTSGAYPGETFTGKVTFISPLMDDATRTVKVRVEMPNPKGKLKPNMFVNANIQNPLTARVAIPESGVLDTGDKTVVFVDRGEDTFVHREVVTGQTAEGYTQILSGLQPGETVVTAATFLLDSQTKLGSFASHGAHGGASKAPATGGHSSTTSTGGAHGQDAGASNTLVTGSHGSGEQSERGKR